MRKLVLVVICLFVCLFEMYAFESIDIMKNTLSEQEIERLMNGNYLEARTNRKQSVSRLAFPLSEAFIISEKAEKTPRSFSVGVLQFIPYSDDFESMSDTQKKLDVYNRMLEISTLEGIQYISYTAGDKPKTLFTEAHMLSNPKSKKYAMADPVVSAIPDFAHYYAFLADTKFGGNIYSADYHVLDDEFYIEITNNSPLKFLGVKCLEENKLHMYVDVKFVEEGILVFGFAVAYDTESEVRALVTTVSLDGAFATRIKAMKDWFILQMEK